MSTNRLKSLEATPLIAEGSIKPFAIPLPLALSLPLPRKVIQGSPYSKGIYRFKQFLDILTSEGDQKLPPNQLGKLAVGLARGSFSSWSAPFPVTGAPTREIASPHVHSHVIENGAIVGINLDDPVTIYNDWALIENGIGPQLQKAMRVVIDSRPTFEAALSLLPGSQLTS